MLPFTLPEVLPCLVAFSGGADSRLLLELTVRALLERDGEEGRRKVIAAHLHHGIRGEEADRDLAFCQRVCHDLGVELICQRVDVPALAAASGESLETAARRARYSFFEEILATRRIPVLMTAHHADDNLETVLERLLRGSGTRGMGGIPPLRLMGAAGTHMAVVYRPLLEWTRRDILAVCRELGLDYVTDSTNLETDCLRNRIRHTVIPALEDIAGIDAPQRAALRMSRNLREDDDFLTGMAERRVYAESNTHESRMELTELRELHPATTKRILALLYRDALLRHGMGEAQDSLAAVHLEALLELIAKGVPESSLSLPRGMEARIRGNWLSIRPVEPPSELPAEPVILGEGRTVWGDGVTVTVEVSPVPLSPLKGEKVFASAVFPPSRPLPLLARKRQAGDSIRSHGMTKKLKKLLNEKEIPPHLRDRVPLICLPNGSPDGEPLWFPAAVFRDGYPAPDEGPCIRISLYVQSSPDRQN